MGMSLDAYLYYGFPFAGEGLEDEEDEDLDEETEDEEDGDLKEEYAASMGIDPPSEPYPGRDREFVPGKGLIDSVYTAEEQQLIEIYHDYWRKVSGAWEASGCEILYPGIRDHGEDYDQKCLYVRDSLVSANALSERVPSEKFPLIEQVAAWDDLLKNCCEKLGIRYRKPGWHLAPEWG